MSIPYLGNKRKTVYRVVFHMVFSLHQMVAAVGFYLRIENVLNRCFVPLVAIVFADTFVVWMTYDVLDDEQD